MSNTSFRSLLGDSGQSDSGVGAELKTFQQEFDKHCGLTKKQRLYGFAICFCIGWFCCIGGLIVLATSLTFFAILYSVGNLVALGSTLFLFGPVAQCKNMFKPIRAVATIVYLITIGTTLGFAFGLENGALVLLSLAVQLLAMIWYTASYIPYGRAMIKKMVGGICKSVMNES